MSEYKSIKGISIQEVSADIPTGNAFEGQVWYNTTTNKLRVRKSDPGSWSTGGLKNDNYISGMAAGTNTATIAAFGGVPPSGGTATELYDGTSWTTANAGNNGRQFMGGGGTSTSALAFGGWNPYRSQTESWNGTNWTNVNSLNTARLYLGGCGSSNTNDLASGGSIFTASPAYQGWTESWNGTNWTSVNNNVLGPDSWGISKGTMQGTNTAAIIFGGDIPPSQSNQSQIWDGTCWTTNPVSMSNSHNETCSGGTNTSALIMGGGPPPAGSTNVTSWNGTTFSSAASKSDVGAQLGGAGASNVNGICFGGTTPTQTNTEEFSSFDGNTSFSIG